ncbi:MAG: hypothetical protein K5705_08425 [Oscillospiraceae bacterium]|nr:hypothetical protein [Oscillospiraceae bacterium]MBQ9905954.1 hypothetical protein [Oscillospiraceae bacterium]MCR4760275.1 hypothetical protein [Oscillospiraceae bacterium]
MKTEKILFCISLAVLGICGLTAAISYIADKELPVFLIRTIGIASLIALPVLGYTAVKKLCSKR